MSLILENITEPQPEPAAEAGNLDVFIEQIHHESWLQGNFEAAIKINITTRCYLKFLARNQVSFQRWNIFAISSSDALDENRLWYWML